MHLFCSDSRSQWRVGSSTSAKSLEAGYKRRLEGPQSSTSTRVKNIRLLHLSSFNLPSDMYIALWTLVYLTTWLLPAAQANSGIKVMRLDKTKAALLVVDHQVGLFQLVRDINQVEYASNVIAHAALAVLFNLPTVLTTSTETGPNGPLPKEVLQLHANSTIIKRKGEVNAWDNEEFRAAVRATNRSQFIIAGITTDVCTAFLALSLAEEGYEIFANSDASGTFTKTIAEDANDRMRSAGVQVLGLFAILSSLMHDWRSSPGAAEVFPFIDKYLPSYSYLARAHAAAVTSGVLLPGESI
ncbi:Isochorismatase-like protein [Ephemerocybe angulata]|uniref:Isochorismatase-like protein n=1 Tax=Ephemerocybe angulata TaxID=980116 RepID=A0A8H6MBE5_9AGAR|nr:Isochorismatase-like protein [Tulosesus angulatus]